MSTSAYCPQKNSATTAEGWVNLMRERGNGYPRRSTVVLDWSLLPWNLRQHGPRCPALRAKTIRGNRPCPTSVEFLAPFLIGNRNTFQQERLLTPGSSCHNPSIESPEGRTALTVSSVVSPVVTAGSDCRRNQPAIRPEGLNHREDCIARANQRQDGGHPRRAPGDAMHRRDAWEPVATRRPDGQTGRRRGRATELA